MLIKGDNAVVEVGFYCPRGRFLFWLTCNRCILDFTTKESTSVEKANGEKSSLQSIVDKSILVRVLE